VLVIARSVINSSDAPHTRWSLPHRVGFRFVFVYLLVYSFPFPLHSIPGVAQWTQWWTALWHAVVPWVGTHVLHLPYDITVFPNGSGDTTFNYVQVLCFAALALVTTIAWSACDAHRAAYPRLHDVLRTYVRYVLGATLLSYGFMKVFKSQFPMPSGERLITPYGDSSPMGILWTFMGASTAYTIFSGLAEVIGGVLLFWRRTTLLGAVISTGVMLNVVMLNFCYDVPVKLYSSHLLLMAIFLVAPDLKRIMQVFLLHHTADPRPLAMPFASRALNVVRRIAKIVIVIVFIGQYASNGYTTWVTYGDAAPRPPLCGVYEVESFSRKGDIGPVMADDPARWQQAVMTRYGTLMCEKSDRSWARYRASVNDRDKTITLTAIAVRPTSETFVLAYTEPASGMLALDGSLHGEQITVQLRRRDESSFLLLNRGFHWINEYPFNR